MVLIGNDTQVLQVTFEHFTTDPAPGTANASVQCSVISSYQSILF